ncbi:hypothetical protein HDA30_001352 [Micrococcus cohnii]|uniref:Helix-turn-helix domain-containing protein n=1 Tax=Micrococcus cohnii TaxID=993416 RepID=A0A7W7M3Q6_9MICC|nr:helix-turn-helix domain-containing protein [Micrococcus cohnii]MBB4735844.1 hypothetical protein [Micrococcus cohnii]
MSTYQRMPAGLVCASVPAPLALVLVRTVSWPEVALKFAQHPEGLEAARFGWAQLNNAAAEYQHHLRQTVTPLPPVEGAASRWITTAQAAAQIGKSAETVRAWCRAGLVTARSEGNAWYIEPESLADYLESRNYREAEARNLDAA